MAKNYPFVVMDNEAGMEHLSRRTTQGVDYLLFLSDYSIKGIRTVGKIRALIDELKLSVKEKYLVVDRAPEELDSGFSREIQEQGAEFDRDRSGGPVHLRVRNERQAASGAARRLSGGERCGGDHGKNGALILFFGRG